MELRVELFVPDLLFVEREEGVPVELEEGAPVTDPVTVLVEEEVCLPVPETEAVPLLEGVEEAVTVGVRVGVLNWEGVFDDVPVGRAVTLPVGF